MKLILIPIVVVGGIYALTLFWDWTHKLPEGIGFSLALGIPISSLFILIYLLSHITP